MADLPTRASICTTARWKLFGNLMKKEQEKKQYIVPTIEVVSMTHRANLLNGSCTDDEYDDELALMNGLSNGRLSG